MADPDAGAPLTPERIEAIVDDALRRYTSRLGRQLMPFLVAALALVLIVWQLPSKSPSSSGGSLAGASSSAATGGTTGSGTTSATGPTSGGGSSGFNLNSVNGSASGGPNPSSGLGSLAPSSGTQFGVQSQAPGGHFAGNDIAVSGVRCGPGVRQVPWESYAPPCVPRWTGNNGGATAHGVTATTITLTYTAYPDTDTLESCKCAEDDESMLRGFISVFNKVFEFYGRHLVLKIVKASGSGAAEFDNQDQAQAQSDAQTAYDAGSFADVAALTLPPYEAALASHHIIFTGVEYIAPRSAAAYAPYAYGNPYWASGYNWGQGVLAMVCRRMTGMPAIFSGSVLTQHTSRKFGLIYPDSPDWSSAGDYILTNGPSACGLHVRAASYNPALADEASEIGPLVSEMKAAGITTIILPADPIAATVAMIAADKQQYFPEWIPGANVDGFYRMYPADQIAHVIQTGSLGRLYGPSNENSCRVLAMAHSPCYASDDPDTLYYPLVNILRAIQAAGPDLTATTFARGMRSLPDAVGGYGLWSGNKPVWQNPQADFVISSWHSNVKAADGQMGDFLPCNAGRRYQFQTAMQTMGTGQLQC